MLSKITATPKTGNEQITNKGIDTNYTLVDFWRWSVSDLLSNATRGRFAEFIVATAVNIEKTEVRDEWSAYDLITPEGIKLEIKSAAYLQSWYQKSLSKISFSIKPAQHWDSETNVYEKEKKRHADLYVFCLLKHTDKATVDPLNLDQWEFYVVTTEELNSYSGSQQYITLKALQRMTESVQYERLRDVILLKNQLKVMKI